MYFSFFQKLNWNQQFEVFKKKTHLQNYVLKLIQASNFSIEKKKKKTHRNLQQFVRRKYLVTSVYAPHPACFIFIIKRDKGSRRCIATFRVNGSRRYVKDSGNDNEVAIVDTVHKFSPIKGT